MARNCEFRRKGGERCNADAQTGKGVCVFHDSDQTKRLIIAEPDAPEASPEAVSQRYCRSTRRTILSVIQTRSRFCWRTPSIGFAEGNSILAAPMRWATWQVFF